MFKRQSSQEAGDQLSREPEAAAEERQGAAAGAPAIERSVIQADLIIRGEILARGALELNGLVEGDVIARSVLVGENAIVRGDVIGEHVSIRGDVRGEVMGHKVHLGAGARYFGDIRRGALSIDDGAVFEGDVKGLGEAGARRIAERLERASPETPELIDVVALAG